MKKKIILLGLLLSLIVFPKSKSMNYSIDKMNYSEGTNIKISDYLKTKANSGSITNYNDGNKTEMYMFSHEATEQTGALTDYRYIGNSPNNYVSFNCDNDGKNCEIWRIIGVFTVEDENGNKEERVKIVRGSSLANKIAWDSGSNENIFSQVA